MADTKGIAKIKDLNAKYTNDFMKQYCRDNNQREWWNQLVSEELDFPTYPRKQVINAEGRKVSVADKSQPKQSHFRRRTVAERRAEFVKKFFPNEVTVKKAKDDWKKDLI